MDPAIKLFVVVKSTWNRCSEFVYTVSLVLTKFQERAVKESSKT